MSRLAHAIKVIATFASTDKKLDLLRTVHVTRGADGIMVEATDRYVIGQYTIPCGAGPVEPVDIIVDAATAKSLATALKGNLTIEDLIPHAIDDIYPNVGRLFKDDRAPVDSIHLDGDYLALFKKNILAFNRDEKGLSVKFEFNGDRRPVTVTFGDHFRGLIMPVRIY